MAIRETERVRKAKEKGRGAGAHTDADGGGVAEWVLIKVKRRQWSDRVDGWLLQ